MNECYSEPTKGSAVQTREKPPASPGQRSSSGLPHQNTAKNRGTLPQPSSQTRRCARSDDTTKGARARVVELGYSRARGILPPGAPHRPTTTPSTHTQAGGVVTGLLRGCCGLHSVAAGKLGLQDNSFAFSSLYVLEIWAGESVLPGWPGGSACWDPPSLVCTDGPSVGPLLMITE